MKSHILALTTMIILTGSSVNFSSPSTTNKEKSKIQYADFAFFRTHRQAKGAVATWAMTSTDGVTTFQLQRTYQDPTDPYSMWEDVTLMPCVGARSFKFNDQSVFAGRIYYRVIAHLADGSSVTSEVSDVRIVSH